MKISSLALFLVSFFYLFFAILTVDAHQLSLHTSSETLQKFHLSKKDYQLLQSQLIEVPKFALEAENFKGVSVNSESSELASFNKGFVLLNFWATWCVPCLTELPDMEKLYQETKEKGVVIVAVAMGQDKKTIENFLRKHPLSFPILADPEGKISKLYGVTNLPVTYLINHDNMVVGRAIGPREWSNSKLIHFFQSQARK